MNLPGRKRRLGREDQGAKWSDPDSRPLIEFWSAKSKVVFGPFTVPAELVTLAGWGCRKCKRPVRKLAQVIPNLVPRMIFHSCDCACVVTWEDEASPSARNWKWLLRLARKTGSHVVCFNGGRESPDFQGVN